MEDNIWHVFPIGDSKDHVLETEWKTVEYGTLINNQPTHNIEQRLICHCKCGATYKEEPNGAIIVIHNSYDGREGLEWVNEIFNKKP